MRFRLVQALNKSNSPTSSIAVLYCGKISCLGCVVECYLYSLEKRLIDMAMFSFYYNPNKHVPDWKFN
jgi:hypothetical protein